MNRPAILHVLLGAMLCLAGLAVPAAAQSVARPAAVVELFTSQGCASCPPADALLTELSARGDVVALAYHVDYWDYIGWADTFGHEDHSNRQRAYAEGWGSSRIYTPQIIVNGLVPVVGSKTAEVHRALGGARLVLPVTLALENGVLAIDIDGQAGLDPAVVWLVAFIDRAEVAIERGENAGKSILYSQVVTARQALGMWEPGPGAHLKFPLAEMLSQGANGVAVIVQQERRGMPGAILGAALHQL